MPISVFKTSKNACRLYLTMWANNTTLYFRHYLYDKTGIESLKMAIFLDLYVKIFRIVVSDVKKEKVCSSFDEQTLCL